jgi:5-methylcytosine-specific restriction endonuclease McrA
MIGEKRARVIRKLMVRFGKVCWYCGIDLSHRQINVDHILPLKLGGDDDLLNLALTCKSCNLAKNFTSLEEFYQWVDYIRSDKFRRIYQIGEIHPQSMLAVVGIH